MSLEIKHQIVNGNLIFSTNKYKLIINNDKISKKSLYPFVNLTDGYCDPYELNEILLNNNLKHLTNIYNALIFEWLSYKKLNKIL